MTVKELLEGSRQRLLIPFGNAQKQLILALNITYLILAPLYFVSERLSTGKFFPIPTLGIVYAIVGIVNLLSALFNYYLLKKYSIVTIERIIDKFGNATKIQYLLVLGSLLTQMCMSFLNMAGYGNPSNDSILADFALGHSLIVLSAVLVGRNIAIAWFLVVVGTLFYVTFRQGWNYQYNYLTPRETLRYEKALSENKAWAIARKAELKKYGLNPPKTSRYFNEWILFIIQALIISYFFHGITHKMFKVIPSISEEIKEAIDSSIQVDLENEREQRRLENEKSQWEQAALKTEMVALKTQYNPHFLFNTLHYFFIKSESFSTELSKNIQKLSEILRYSLMDNPDNKVELMEEIKFSKILIELHQMRFRPEKFNVAFELIGEEFMFSKRIIPLSIITFIENSIKHGNLSNSSNPLKIIIKAGKNKIDILVTNPKNKRKNNNSTHLGIQNLTRRLELSYPNAHTFKIEQDENQYTTHLTLKD